MEPANLIRYKKANNYFKGRNIGAVNMLRQDRFMRIFLYLW